MSILILHKNAQWRQQIQEVYIMYMVRWYNGYNTIEQQMPKNNNEQ